MRNRDTEINPPPDSARGGLTKREYAAIAAMQGILADPSNIDPRLLATADANGIKPVQVIAGMAANSADALFDELEKDGG